MASNDLPEDTQQGGGRARLQQNSVSLGLHLNAEQRKVTSLPTVTGVDLMWWEMDTRGSLKGCDLESVSAGENWVVAERQQAGVLCCEAMVGTVHSLHYAPLLPAPPSFRKTTSTVCIITTPLLIPSQPPQYHPYHLHCHLPVTTTPSLSPSPSPPHHHPHHHPIVITTITPPSPQSPHRHHNTPSSP